MVVELIAWAIAGSEIVGKLMAESEAAVQHGDATACDPLARWIGRIRLVSRIIAGHEHVISLMPEREGWKLLRVKLPQSSWHETVVCSWCTAS